MNQSIIEAQAAQAASIYKQSHEYAILMQQLDLIYNLCALTITRIPQDERGPASDVLEGIKTMC
jgi:hypothetical protein